jgi:glutamyl-tRNA reductase
MTHLVLVGTSHHLAPVELREQVAVDREHAAELAAQLGEAVVLSTCNRTEIYVAALDADDAERRAVAALADVEPALYRLRDRAAALHLFRVAAGLDSLVPGEGEILGQVRTAYENGTPGFLLDRVFRHALHAGRKVRTQTAIGESPSSVSAAAAALAEQVFGDLGGCRILMIGSGEVGEQAARNLRTRGAEIVLTANSKTSREDLAAQLATADVVVSSTSSPDIVLDAETVERHRHGRQLLLIDLAVPRDLDPAIHELDGCFLYDIDDLQAIVVETLAGRRSEAERAETIVAAEAEKFHEWHASLDVVPAIASLRARAEAIREAELRKAEPVLGKLDESERNAIESLTAQIVNKLLHLPTVRMKQAAAAADGVVYAEAVRHLFGLGEDERR